MVRASEIDGCVGTDTAPIRNSEVPLRTSRSPLGGVDCHVTHARRDRRDPSRRGDTQKPSVGLPDQQIPVEQAACVEDHVDAKLE